MATAPKVDVSEAELQLERILTSGVFQKAQRSQRFLRYLVELAHTQPNTGAKEYTVALDVFDRPMDYDPAVDATVRVEASRLRNRLREYYDEEGRNDSLVISVPKGVYQATFSRRPAPHDFVGKPPLAAGVSGATHITARISLAIVPFANQTGDSGKDYIADGFADVLTRQLAGIPALKLIAHASVARYRNHPGNPWLIGQSLGVANVLIGKLRSAGDRLSVVTELCRVADESVLSSEEYFFAPNDLRLVHAEVQRDLLNHLNAEDSARNPGKGLRNLTIDAEAYQEFLHGERVAKGMTPPDLLHALRHLERAVALDQEFDTAWAAIASIHAIMGLYFDAPRKHMPAARSAAETAIRINPSLGEAYGTLGIIHLTYDWDSSAARDKMATPGAQQAAVGTLACSIHLTERMGRPRTAEAMLGRALSYDPLSPALVAETGCLSYYRGHYDDALARFQNAMECADHSPLPYWGLGKTLNAMGRYEEAIDALMGFEKKMAFEPPVISAEIGYALGRSSRTTEARAMIKRLVDQSAASYVDPYFVSLIFLSMQENEATFLWLDKAIEARSPFVISLATEPKWNSYRALPEFAERLRRIVPVSRS
jgi:TolB-like protein